MRTVSGTAFANTVTAGTFTIPMMKKAEFEPHVAGGVETVTELIGIVLVIILLSLQRRKESA